MARCRLVTIVGPGGIGKTLLASEYALLHAGRFEDDPVFVHVAGVADAASIARAVMHALQLSERPGEPPENLVREYLQSKTDLLIFDEAESAAGAIAPLI